MILANQGVILPVTISPIIAKVEHAREVGISAKSIDYQQQTDHRPPVGV
jgi:hypothetical protein